MTDQELRNLLVAIPELQRDQAEVSSRILGWFLAVSDTLRKNPQFEAVLREHDLFDLGPQSRVRNIGEMTQRIDALIQRLKVLP